MEPKRNPLHVADAADEYAAHAHATKTRTTYEWAWRDFTRWGAENGIQVFPADPRHVAVWLADSANAGLSVSSIVVMRAAIGRAHREAGHPDPTQDEFVRLTVKGIRRKKGIATLGAKAPLCGEHIALMVRGIKRTDPNRARDSAALLLGYMGALRRSELAALTVNDLRFASDGSAVTLIKRRSKTDQEGRGHEIKIPALDNDVCPVTWAQQWLKERKPGARLFGWKCGRSIANMIKRRAQAVGIDPALVSGHSLRAGFVTTASLRGASDTRIMKVTGHKSVATLARYVRTANVFSKEDNLL